MRSLFSVRFLVALVLAVAAAAPVLSHAAGSSSYRVVVNPQNSATSVDRKFVVDAFLKKITRWPDGEIIRPVDLSPDSPARGRFSDEIIKRSVSAVKSYWQQLVFSGREVPPPEMDSDEDVIRYVLRFPGAIGYVSGAANAEHVKVVTILR
ncbi:MAG TPA: phosphate ABC transporter substrate-binding protein [Polyangia bacterium]|nr:phosphate ABC transporter substrate-binding protein [Polyangia bacterium]